MAAVQIETHRRRFRELVEKLERAGRAPILLYGGGTFTAELDPLSLARWGTVIGIVDDDAGRWGSTWAGLPVLKREAIAASGARSVIVTSMNAEAQQAIAAQAGALADAGLAVEYCPDMGHASRLAHEHERTGGTSNGRAPMVNLNLGGGWAWREPGWLNLEESLKYNFGEVGLRGFPDGCAERIYSSHAMEHVTLDTARRVLTDCRRVLKPGGVLRIVVPDCELFVRAWREKNEGFITGNPALASVFSSLRECTVQMGGNPAGFDTPSQIGHHFFYDRWSLTWLLLLCGFQRVEESSFGTSLDPVMAKPAALNERGDLVGGFDHPSYRPISVYMEAVA